MLTRQKAILRLIENEGRRIGKMRLFKLAFMISNEPGWQDTSLAYQFIPYQFGPYSFTLAHELKTLERDGFLRVMDSEIRLVDFGERLPEPNSSTSSVIDSMSRRYKRVSTDDLVSIVYRQFPWFTAKARDKSRRGVQVPISAPAVFTVGYEGLMLDGLLDLLLRAGIKQLIDVRANPVARRFGFHKSTLDRHCTDVGIKYLHFPELGIPSAERADLQGPDSYKRLFDSYSSETLVSNRGFVDTVSVLIKQTPSALMCMEADATCCHRTCLANLVSEMIQLPIKELRIQ
jgi:uncharacterized protein (DUF488 family)